MPQMSDPNFRRAVVLVVHHDAESTFGLVLNREVELTTRELCESLEFVWNGEGADEVAWGGHPRGLISGRRTRSRYVL